MRVLLVALDSDYDNSLALDYLVSYARQDPRLRDEVEFSQLVVCEKVGAPVDSVLCTDWDLVGFNTYVWNVSPHLALANRLKTANPRTNIVLGGMEAAYTAADLLRAHAYVDFVVLGEGEIVFADLLRRLLLREPHRGIIPGLAYRGPLGVVMGGQPPVASNLDEIPSPFSTAEFVKRGSKRLLYESYRGCAFRCGFCLYHRDYTQRRVFSLERVQSDLRAISQAGCSHVRFVDSTFNLDRSRAKSILRLLAELHMTVSVEVSAEFFDEEMIRMLVPAGIKQVDIGLQSTNESALTAVNRTWYKEERFRQNLALLRDEPGLTLNVELIAGLPGDDYRGLKQSIDEAVQLWPDHVSIYRLLGLHGTDIERRKEKLGLCFSEMPPYEVTLSPGFSKEELAGIDLLVFAHLFLFNLGIGRYSLRYVVDNAVVTPTEVYGDFIEFLTVNCDVLDHEKARLLGRLYAHGNRFDRDLPTELAPEFILHTLGRFFSSIAARLRPCEFLIIHELLDYGYQLAVLDKFEETAASHERNGSDYCVAPWCSLGRYSCETYQELRRQVRQTDDLAPTEVEAILFFIHPQFGPATMAVDAGIAGLVQHGISGRVEIPFFDIEDAETRKALRALQELQVFVPSNCFANAVETD